MGDDVARFEDLHRRAFRSLTGYALRRSPPEDAADAIAETFLIAWRRLENLPAPPDDVPWLYGVARKVLANQRRSARRRGSLVARLAVDIAPAVRAVEPPGDLAQAMAALRDDDRELLRLVAWEGLSTSQIAVALDCTANAAAIRLHRARLALRTALDPDERTPPSRTGPPRRPTDA